jgi:hypothetical protein
MPLPSSHRPSLSHRCRAFLSRWLRASWFARLPTVGHEPFGWFHGRDTGKSARRPVPLYLERFEGRFHPNDLLSATTGQLLAVGLSPLVASAIEPRAAAVASNDSLQQANTPVPGWRPSTPACAPFRMSCRFFS